jgi:hypothetical protein
VEHTITITVTVVTETDDDAEQVADGLDQVVAA